MLRQRLSVQRHGLPRFRRHEIAAQADQPARLPQRVERLVRQVAGRKGDLPAVRFLHEGARFRALRPTHLGVLARHSVGFGHVAENPARGGRGGEQPQAEGAEGERGGQAG